ncbi:hypothetical protein BD414DRAFT_538896 [Trametes punicea]|nr:hypothetical protein BD414DRAFT_538896 [Trametes punicea]
MLRAEARTEPTSANSSVASKSSESAPSPLTVCLSTASPISVSSNFDHSVMVNLSDSPLGFLIRICQWGKKYTIAGRSPEEAELCAPLQVTEWDRFRCYAWHVRRIIRGFPSDDLPLASAQRLRVPRSVFEASTAYFPHGSLLPILKTLHVSHGGSPSFDSSVPVLFGPHLKSTFTTTRGKLPGRLLEDVTPYAKIFAMLHGRAPHLRSLRLCTRDDQESIRSVVVENHNLDGVGLSSVELPASALLFLRLPNLSTLTVELPYTLGVDDSLMRAIAASWALTRNLQLGISELPHDAPPARATLAGGSRAAPAEAARDPTGARRVAARAAIAVLCVRPSPLAYEDVLPVGSFLSDLLPGLQSVDWAWSAEEMPRNVSTVEGRRTWRRSGAE